MKISKAAKFWVAALFAGVIAAQAAITDGELTTTELVTIGLAVLSALGVYRVPNGSDEPQPPVMRGM